MTTSDPFSGITAFVTAAHCQSFSEAARQLKQSPSAVSKGVSRLENELGVKLFHRSPRLVSLTPDGEAFFDRCKDLITTAVDARSVVSNQNAMGKGHLRVCLPISFGQTVVAPALNSWLASHPELTLEIVLSDNWVDIVQERFDAAIRFNDVPDSRLIAHKLTKPEFITVASPSYLENFGQPKTVSELKQHRCLGYVDKYTNQIRPWLFQTVAKEKTKQLRHVPAPHISSDQGSFLLNLASSGAGIMHGPKYLLKHAIEQKSLQPVLTNHDSTGPKWFLVHAQQRQASLKLQHFVRFIKELAQ
jgi:DNA-binding transcriptional LysR family regulator